MLADRCWCERGDSNPHGFPRQILSLVRLPIPPLSHLQLPHPAAFISLDANPHQAQLRPWLPKPGSVTRTHEDA